MKLLFIHQNFPGQWLRLADAARKAGHQVIAIGQVGAADKRQQIEGVTLRPYKVSGAGSSTHQYLRMVEAAVRRGQGVVREIQELRKTGFMPDVIGVHPGWGEGLYLKEVLPRVPVLSYCEFYSRTTGADVGFDPEFPSTLDDACRVQTRNTVHLLSLEACDLGLSPTEWQRSVYPADRQPKITVMHDGIDTQVAKPRKGAAFAIPAKRLQLTDADEVVTYVARNLEPYRGFHVFMRALPALLARRPKAHVVLVGGDEVSYGRTPEGGATWRTVMLREIGKGFDEARVHFMGRIPYDQYLALLQVSRAHVYLTYPFVLSWSALEAMAAGCAMVASGTPPVREVMQHKHNALLFDFFSQGQLVDAVCEALDGGPDIQAMRKRARETVQSRYDLRPCLNRRWQMIKDLAQGGTGRA